MQTIKPLLVCIHSPQIVQLGFCFISSEAVCFLSQRGQSTEDAAVRDTHRLEVLWESDGCGQAVTLR